MSNDEMSLCTESVKDTSKLDGNVSGPNNDDLLWLFLDIKESIGIDTVRCARDVIIRWDSGSTTDRYGNLLGLDLVFRSVVLSDFESVGVDKLGPSFMVVDFLFAQIALAIMVS